MRVAVRTAVRSSLATALGLVGAVLLVVWFTGDPEERDARATADRSVTGTALPLPASVGEDAASPSVAAVAASPSARVPSNPAPPGLDVLVRDAVTWQPVAGASVDALADSPAALAADVPLAADAVAHVETDGAGRGRLSWPEGRPPARLLARAPGYRVAVVGPPLSDGSSHEVRLEPGLEMVGAVTDRAGKAVAGVEVGCEHATLPRSPDSSPLLAAPGRENDLVRTNEGGEFRLRGLSPGPYRLRVLADGWILDQSLHGSSVRSPRRIDVLQARAGGPFVRIVLTPIRTYRLRLLSAVGGRPVGSSGLAVDVSAGRGAPSTSFLSFGDEAPPGPHRAGAEPRPVLAARSEPGVVEGSVILDDLETEETRGDAVVDAVGYLPARVALTLRLPSETAAGAPPDVVRLVPEDPSAVGTIVVDCGREETTLWRPETRILSGCRLADERRFHVRGERVGEERWEFVGIPTGEAVIHVFDGLSHSLPVKTTVPERGTGFVSARFPDPTGVTLVLRDAQGRRLFDAELLLVLSPDQDRGAPNLARITRWRQGPAGPLDVLHPLTPGPYRYAVAKRGVGEAAGEFVVEPGRVARLEAVLAPRAREAGPPAASQVR